MPKSSAMILALTDEYAGGTFTSTPLTFGTKTSIC